MRGKQGPDHVGPYLWERFGRLLCDEKLEHLNQVDLIYIFESSFCCVKNAQ